MYLLLKRRPFIQRFAGKLVLFTELRGESVYALLLLGGLRIQSCGGGGKHYVLCIYIGKLVVEIVLLGLCFRKLQHFAVPKLV